MANGKRRGILERIFPGFVSDIRQEEEEEELNRELSRLKLQEARRGIEAEKPEFSIFDLPESRGLRAETQKDLDALFGATGFEKTPAGGFTRRDAEQPLPTGVSDIIERELGKVRPFTTPTLTREQFAKRALPPISTKAPPEQFTQEQIQAINSDDIGSLVKAFGGKVPKSALTAFQTRNRPVTGVDPNTGLPIVISKAAGTSKRLQIPGLPRQQDPTQKRKFAQFVPNERKLVLRESELFRKDKTIQDLEERLSKSGEIEALTTANPREAYGVLAGAFTRLAGEVGRLTDQDIDRNIKPKAILSRLKQALSLFQDGRFPPERIEEMKIILDIAQKVAIENFNKKADNATKRMLAIIPNADPDEVKLLIAGSSLVFDSSMQYSKQILGGGEEEINARLKEIEKRRAEINKRLGK